MSLRLEDIELIRRLKYKYWRCLDTGDIAGMREVFTEDMKVDYIGGSYRWQMAGREKILQSSPARSMPTRWPAIPGIIRRLMCSPRRARPASGT